MIYFLLCTLALIQTFYVQSFVIRRNVGGRMARIAEIKKAKREPPYRYRILTIILGNMIEAPLKLSKRLNYAERHILVYSILTLIILTGINIGFYRYLALALDFDYQTALLGVFILNAIIPMSVTGMDIEGDFLTLLAYVIGMLLLRYDMVIFIPVLIAIAALNREQIIFFVLWMGIYFIDDMAIDTYLLLFVSVWAWGIVTLFLRYVQGYKKTRYTIKHHISNNTDWRNRSAIFHVWGVLVLPIAMLSVFGYNDADVFSQRIALTLPIYSAAFFLCGNLWELAKFLPAYLVMIPILLRAI